jgi:hypothetical protein
MSDDRPNQSPGTDREWFRSLFHGNYRPLLAYARRRVDAGTADDVVAANPVDADALPSSRSSEPAAQLKEILESIDVPHPSGRPRPA